MNKPLIEMITNYEEKLMKNKKLFTLVSLLLVFVLMSTACKPEAPSEPVEKPVVEEPSVDVVVEEPAAAAPSEEAEFEVYRIAILADITSSNVWNLFGPGASAYNYVVQVNYWPTLFTVSDHRWDFVPQFAADFGTAIEQEDDFWVTTISLKGNFFWSDGTEVTAEDVAFTSQVVMDFGLSGNWDYAGGDLNRIDAIDSKTVKLYYNEKPGLAVHEYGILQNAIVNQAYWEPKLAEAYAALKAVEGLDPESEEYLAELTEAQQILYGVEAEDEPVYGAFKFQKWEVGAFVENNANDSHFYRGVTIEEYDTGAYREQLEGVYDYSAYGEATEDPELAYVNGPHADSVIYSIYSQDAAVLALLNGDVDYIYNPNGYGPGLRAQLEGNPDVTLAENPRNGWRFMAFNFNTPPLDDIAVRQAITCMIDKEFLTGNILQGAAFPAYTPVPEGLGFWYNPDVTRICYGLSEQERMDWAMNRLKEVGYSWDVEPSWNEDRGGSIDWGEGLKTPDGSYVPELLLLAPSPGYDPLRATSGVLIEQWAGMLGFPVRAKLTNFNNILNETLGGGGNWDMVVLGWSLTPYPNHMCDFFLADYGGPFAFTSYAGEDLIRLCQEFTAITDLEEARLIGYEMQEVLATELPYTYLFANPVQDAYNALSVEYPFTVVLDGLEGIYGVQHLVASPE
jgi:peptide/nickel transport system substrate-binding protein